jgi:hypothetical protein
MKYLKEKSNIIDTASAKIAGSKHGHNNEVQAQVKKARTTSVAKNTHEVVNNLLPKKMPKVKY